jgi:hypothetical protein
MDICNQQIIASSTTSMQITDDIIMKKNNKRKFNFITRHNFFNKDNNNRRQNKKQKLDKDEKKDEEKKDEEKKDEEKKDEEKKDEEKKDKEKKDEEKKDEENKINKNRNKKNKKDQIIFILLDNKNPNVPEVPPNEITERPFISIKPREPECKNPLCDHKTFEEDSTEVEQLKLDKIRDIVDLINLGKTYHCKKNKEFNGINLRLLCNLVLPLTELQNMVGMTNVKEQMVNQILFFLQGFNKHRMCGTCVDCAYNLPCARNTEDMLHTVITGPPGVGKTELGKILAKVYKEMGVLSKGHFRIASRADLIGKYLGHTAAKTQSLIEECVGGVLFIDEAYSLGNPEGRDSFSKECIDTINQNLTEKRDFLCIIAGYKDELEKCFFSYNEGLRRRFTFRYDIKGYDGKELRDIFLTKVRKDGWTYNSMDLCIEPKELETLYKNSAEYKNLTELFTKNKNNFPNYGGDVETLFLNSKIVHSNRMVFGEPEKRRSLTLSDIQEGLEVYLKNRKYGDAKKKNKLSDITTTFYGN